MGLLGAAYLPVHSRRRGSEREVQGVAVLGEDRRQSASISHTHVVATTAGRFETRVVAVSAFLTC